MNLTIPEKIRKLTGSRVCTVDTVGMSDARVLCFDDMVLKIENQCEESENERRIMAWLAERLPVPEILCSAVENGVQYLLMSRAEGEMACSEENMQNPDRLVKLLAKGLKMLWSVDSSDCPCSNTLDRKLLQAEQNVRSNLCETECVEPDTYGAGGFRNPAELLEWLKENKPPEQIVFSHGDFCLPNIFLKGDRVSGLIDLGRSGTADLYQDIALCYRSLKHNFDGAYGGRAYAGLNAEMLFEELGIEPDWDKIRYYILLDELF